MCLPTGDPCIEYDLAGVNRSCVIAAAAACRSAASSPSVELTKTWAR
jgi:hypothetical protein